jgi:uncharacterized protein YdaU (DUF1376 family)
MRYYKHNIGDFLADTHYLSNPRLAVYIKLVWEYYLQEKPIITGCLEEKAEELKTNLETLEYVLYKYFQQVQENDVWLWRHKRIDSELAKMNSTNQKKSEGAQSRWNNDTTINGFEDFWKAYPNKKDKQKAMKAWAKHQPDLAKVLKALKTQKNSEQWKKDDGRFIPLPTTWLNGARWEDEIDGKPEKVDRLVIGNILAKADNDFYTKSKEEQSSLINNYIKENV